MKSDYFSVLDEANEVFSKEISALEVVNKSLGRSFFDIFCEIQKCKGKLVLSGVGKPGHICKKAAATFSSLGTPAIFVQPDEAQHGDLGMIQKADTVILVSYSGESSELTKLLPNLKKIGSKTIAITGRGDSSLAKQCDIVQTFPFFDEAGYLKLAPTSSTTVTLVYFDALAISIAKFKNFTKKDFGLFHPSGSLGKTLLETVDDLMVSGNENAKLLTGSSLKDAVSEMCGKPVGLLNVLNSSNILLGIITDGDIRRALNKDASLKDTTVDEIMTVNPVFAYSGTLASDALNIMIRNKVQSLPVVDSNNSLVGTLQMKDILKEGIFSN